MPQIEVSEGILESLNYFSKKWRDACTGEPSNFNEIIGCMIQDQTRPRVFIELTDSTLKALEDLSAKYPPDITREELVNHLIQVMWCNLYK